MKNAAPGNQPGSGKRKRIHRNYSEKGQICQMNIYEIDARINELLSSLEPDPDTGEVMADVEVLEQINALEGQRADKLEHCARAYFEAVETAEKAKAEKLRLAERQSKCERRAERILKFLAYAVGGQKTNLGIATISFPKPRPSIVTTDAAAAAAWLARNGHPDLYTVPAPKLCANEVKRLLLDDVEIPGVSLEYNQKAVLK